MTQGLRTRPGPRQKLRVNLKNARRIAHAIVEAPCHGFSFAAGAAALVNYVPAKSR